jgi:hypothetical protein
MGLWKNEWWDKECREGKQAARKKLKKLKKKKKQKSTQELQISMQREEGKETDGRRTEDEGYKDGRRGVEIYK